MDCPLKSVVPSWLKNDNDDFTVILRTKDTQKTPALRDHSSIKSTAWNIFSNLPHLMYRWTINVTRLSEIEITQLLKILPSELDKLAGQLAGYAQNRSFSGFDFKKSTEELATSINDITNKLLLICSHPSEPELKSSIITSYTNCILFLKTHDQLAGVWNLLADTTKKTASAAVPYALEPGFPIGENLTDVYFDRISVSYRLPVKFGEGTCYSLKLHSKGVGSFKYILNDAVLTFWKWIVPPDSNAETKKNHKDLLERIEKANSVFQSRMADVTSKSRIENFSQSIKPDFRESIPHQTYQLLKHYHDVMFASLGFPVKLPFHVGSYGEYTITKPFELVPLLEHLKACDLISQKSLAQQLVAIARKELIYGFHFLKNVSFYAHEETIYAKETEDFFVPLTVVEYAEKMHHLIQEIKKEYGEFPHFVNQVTKILHIEYNSYIRCTNELIPLLELVKVNKDEKTFFKTLQLANLCLIYDINFAEISKNSTNAVTRERLISDLILVLLKKIPRHDHVPELYSAIRVIGPHDQAIEIDTNSTFTDNYKHLQARTIEFKTHSTFTDNFLELQAQLEKLMICHLVLSALESNDSFTEFFSAISEESFTKCLPSEETPFFIENDQVTSNREYFQFIFLDFFLPQLASQITEIEYNPMESYALYYAHHKNPEVSENYKLLLHNHLIKFNQVKKANDFICRILD